MNKLIKRVDLAYIAGFVDGEGYIGIKKKIRRRTNYSPCYSERVSVGNINKEVIDNINNLVNGYVKYRKASKLTKNGCWYWEVTEEKARKFLKMIYPYLIVKKPEADILKQLSENKKETNRSGVPKENLEFREKLYLKIKEIHKYEEKNENIG